jgi:tetratricopeptide (TPR) repeat protein
VSARRRNASPWGLAACLAFAAFAFAAACRTLVLVAPAPPVSSAASAAFEEARAWSRGPDPLDRERARAAYERATDLAPDWVAPRRQLDTLATEDLLGIEALARHRKSLETRPDDATELYLAGRLEGARGAKRFEEAAAVDPSLSWAHHGLGFIASQRDVRLAIRHQERALALARDPWERTFFTSTLARYLVAADEPKRAIEVLEERLADPEIAAVDEIELSVQTALIELGLVLQPEYQRGWERALRLLRESDLTDQEVEDLVRRLRFLRSSESGSLELQLALASRPGAARDRWRADLLLDQRPSPLALGLLRRAEDTARSAPLMRAARFAAGQFALGVEEWLADLPRAVLDGQRLPLDPRLRSVVELARSLSHDDGADSLAAFGDALLDAGWFREARAVAARLAIDDLDRALALEDQAAASQQLLSELQRTLDAAQPQVVGHLAGPTQAKRRSEARTLVELLAACAAPIARSNAVIGGETDEARLRKALVESPLIDYAGLASIVHPGPHFSKGDEREGLGREGGEVPGFAAVLSRLGRFGIFGQMMGAEPDGTILARVHVATRRGEHLGVPWSGTIAWCEGADLKSRAGRLGAEISGAALHEGYWVDIDSLRRERGPWRDFERQFFRGQPPERVERALSSRGIALSTPKSRAEDRRRERRDVSILLGQADRMRLAVIADRKREHPDEPGITLDELLEITSTHEEGHLCDRTRFLPLSSNWFRALALLAKCGFSPDAVSRRLEYRAQLVSLCSSTDPRVPLVSVLRSAESGGGEVTPHASAYRELLADLLAALDEELESRPAQWTEIDPDYVLAHQLHRLGPESVRRLCRKLARREGLFED